MSNTCSNSKWRIHAYVDIEISEIPMKSTYKDPCNTSVTIRKYSGTPKPGFKMYTHTLPGGMYWLGGIYYHKVLQSGFSAYLTSYHTMVKVYYLESDEANLLPLLVGMTWDGENYLYYRQIDYLKVTNKWERDHSVKDDSMIYHGLQRICKHLSGFAILRLDATNGKTYQANGTYTDVLVHTDMKIHVTNSPREFDDYNKYTHKPVRANHMCVLATRNGSTCSAFDPPISDYGYTEASVYYWVGDVGLTTPLIFGIPSMHYFFFLQSNKWKKCDINGTLSGQLNRLNCLKNGTHEIEISRKSDTQYPCSLGCGISVKALVDNKNQNYLKVTHSSVTLSLSRFTDNGRRQQNLPLVKDVSGIDIYFSKNGASNPLIIMYSSGGKHHWYRRVTHTDDKWVVVDNADKPSLKHKEMIKDDKIKKLLEFERYPDPTKAPAAPPKKPEVPPAKVPEAPKEVVPEKKVPAPPPKKPEVPPAKVPEAPKEVIPEKKVPVAPPKKPESTPSRPQGHPPSTGGGSLTHHHDDEPSLTTEMEHPYHENDSEYQKEISDVPYGVDRTGVIATGATVGILIAGLLTYECTMINVNPARSVTRRLFGSFRGFRILQRWKTM